VGDPAVVIDRFPVVVVLQIYFLLELLMGGSFLFFSYFRSFQRSRLVNSLLLGLYFLGCYLNFYSCLSGMAED
jgi:hypothetical protein